jgi:signal peptidase
MAQSRPGESPVGGVIKNVVFVVAAAAGVLSVAWVAASLVFGLSLVSLATGSMAPSMPTGTLALVREVPAGEIKVGQVVTLQRADEALPITHRVIGVEADGATAGRIVRMQGDANPVPDIRPYNVVTGKLVLASVPGLAAVANAVVSPAGLAVSTLLAAALALWAFWPPADRRLAPHRARPVHRAH